MVNITVDFNLLLRKYIDFNSFGASDWARLATEPKDVAWFDEPKADELVVLEPKGFAFGVDGVAPNAMF